MDNVDKLIDSKLEAADSIDFKRVTTGAELLTFLKKTKTQPKAMKLQLNIGGKLYDGFNIGVDNVGNLIIK